MTSLAARLEQFRGMRVLVVGDVMLDTYYQGSVNRISPEAPVPVVNVSSVETRLGGAANVALNLKALGAVPILCTVAGNDPKSILLTDLLRAQEMSTEGILCSKSRPTTVKTRIMSGGQHLLRVDEESALPLSQNEVNMLMKAIQFALSSNCKAVILEDYNKGVLTPEVISQTIQLCKELNIPVVVDPKKDNFFAYKGVALFKPNLKELKEGLKVEFDKTDRQAVLNAVEEMEKRLKNEISLVTMSELGLLVKRGVEAAFIAAHPREITDVSGAGDTVISIAALCLAAGAGIEEIASLANLAGGLVCEKPGVVPIDAAKLLAEAENLSQS